MSTANGRPSAASGTIDTAVQQGENAFSVSKVTKEYDDFTLGPVDISLPRGYIMGLVGANGAGKTTLIRMLLGLAHTTSGTVTALGQRVDAQVGCPLGVAAVLEDGPFGQGWSPKTVRRYLKVLDPTFNPNRFDELCSTFELAPRKRTQDMSKGQRVKLQIAAALARTVNLIVMDEPTAGLDPAARIDLLRTLQEFIVDGKRSILMSSHISSDVETICDYVTVLVNGNQVASEPTPEFIDSYRMVKGSTTDELGDAKQYLLGIDQTPTGFTALAHTSHVGEFAGMLVEPASLDNIVAHLGWAARTTTARATS